ncbi:MAG: phasin family protein [Syntrophomonadaceae bacterium]|jgi:polyhydroxyalkanoate synthesis regulator phasin
MTNMLEKMFYFGLGALTMTKEKAEKLYNELVEKGEMSREEAKIFIDEAVKKGEEGQKEIRRFVKQEMEQFKQNMALVSRAEFEALEKRVSQLEKQINQ